MMHVTLRMQSRWHVGTGTAGSAGADAAQYTLGGAPAVPGSHFKGVVRDVARMVAGVHGADALASAMDAVFGRQGDDGADTWMFAACRLLDPESAKARLSSHNRVDRLTGTVGREAFHNREVVVPQVETPELTTVVEPRADHAPIERALVAASIVGLESLGARRTRGMGVVRCEVRWSDRDGELAFAELIEPLRALGGGAP